MKNICILCIFAGFTSQANAQSAEVVVQPGKMVVFVENAKAKVAEHLKDPSSVQWRKLFIQDSFQLCGELNAKNVYGGYVGFRRFVSAPFLKIQVVEGEDIQNEKGEDAEFKFNEYWERTCKKDGAKITYVK